MTLVTYREATWIINIVTWLSRVSFGCPCLNAESVDTLGIRDIHIRLKFVHTVRILIGLGMPNEVG